MLTELFKFPLFIILLLVLVNGSIHSIAFGYYFDWYGGTNDNFLNSLLPWDVQQLPQEPRADFYRDLRSCLNVLTRECNAQLYYYIFRKKRMNGACCQRFLQMGRPCKDSFAWTLINTEKYEKYEGHIRERSEAMFNRCSQYVGDYGWY